LCVFTSAARARVHPMRDVDPPSFSTPSSRISFYVICVRLRLSCSAPLSLPPSLFPSLPPPLDGWRHCIHPFTPSLPPSLPPSLLLDSNRNAKKSATASIFPFFLVGHAGRRVSKEGGREGGMEKKGASLLLTTVSAFPYFLILKPLSTYRHYQHHHRRSTSNPTHLGKGGREGGGRERGREGLAAPPSTDHLQPNTFR